MWNDVRHDLDYAVRSLKKSPAFSLVSILTLALGIGANTAIFSIINGVLLRPLPYHAPDRIVFLWSSKASLAREPLTPARLVDFRDRLTTLASVAGISQIPLNLTGNGDPERVAGSSVSSNFFDVLGARALLGDPFHSGVAGDRDVVLSYGLWVRRFGRDPAIVGRAITLNGSAHRVVAVMPDDFRWPAITGSPGASGGPELWIPGTIRDVPSPPNNRAGVDISTNRTAGYVRAVARLTDGVTIGQAQSEAEIVAGAIGQEHPETDGARSAVLVPLRAQFFGNVNRSLAVLEGAVALMLAIACANVASLLLGRAASRRRDIAIRIALGASRRRIIRQLLTESIVLACAGAACGLILAWWAHTVLAGSSQSDVAAIGNPRIDLTVLAFTSALAVVTGILFGLVPALQVSAGRTHSDLHDGGTRTSASAHSMRTREVLVTLQLAVALVLLIGALLLVRSFSALQRVDTGIDTRNLLTFDIFLTGPRAESQPRQAAFYDEMLARVRSFPDVVGAGAAVTLPIGGDDFSAAYTVDGQPMPSPGREPSAGYQVVTPGYFDAMGIPMLAGRDFNSADTATSPPVVLVNHTLAVREWPGEDPVGRRLRSGREGPWMTVVGVVADIRHKGPAAAPRPEFYQPHTQRSFSFMAFVVRTRHDPAAVVPFIRAEVSRLDAAQPVSGVATMEEHLARALSRPRFMSRLLGAFGVLALALALVGVYGVMAYSVSERTREIAIRMALGARSGDVISMILLRTAALTAIGLSSGLVAAGFLSRGLSGMLFGIRPLDLPTFVAAACLLATASLAAGGVPAFRATRIRGTSALRD